MLPTLLTLSGSTDVPDRRAFPRRPRSTTPPPEHPELAKLTPPRHVSFDLTRSVPSPDWLPDFTHDLRAVLDYVDLPSNVYRRLPIWVVNHSAIAVAWKTKETYDVVAQHAPFLKENAKL